VDVLADSPPIYNRVKIMVEMCLLQTVQRLRLVARLRGRQNSINVRDTGKRKFVAQFHIDPDQSGHLPPKYKAIEGFGKK
jgi:hypothetical protein